ncbi:unnamed protein product [Pseudo-nitzschia multistriata]|uniref:Acyltransferase n=2 Tax=Pseudo-nitzschia multistriata TaxID=183589 RepID=A0A448ZF16_9STRA|nr:unnamed protein product [Pseudo-nitzschia multistriata]
MSRIEASLASSSKLKDKKSDVSHGSTKDTNSHPSIWLKLQAFMCVTLLMALILLVNLGGIYVLFNPGSSRSKMMIYFLMLYASIRLLTPGGAIHSEKQPEGGVWRAFSERYFFLSSIHRRYLNLSFAKPLPKELVEAESRSNAQFILAAFPHGCNSDFRVLMDGIINETFPNLLKRNKIRALAASILFWIPVVREISLWTGCIDASRPVAKAALDQGKSLLILPGGEAEQIRTVYGREIIYLKNRKGFIKLALVHGVPIVPMYVFGCSDSYYTYNWMAQRFRLWLVKNLGICITPCSGLWGNPFCPLPKTTTIVMGKPIRFEFVLEQDNLNESCIDTSISKQTPTKEEVDRAHAVFIRELTALFDAHKTALGYGDRTLEIV